MADLKWVQGELCEAVQSATRWVAPREVGSHELCETGDRGGDTVPGALQ